MKLSRAEKKAVRWALSKKKPWDVDGRKSAYNADPRSRRISILKARLKKYHEEKQGFMCCYCKVPLNGRNIEIDREHIVPKSRYKQLSYTPMNISVACKTCNMSVKKQKISHLRGYRKSKQLKSRDLRDQRNYNIVHPNIHDWHEHIELYAEQNGTAVARIYYPKTARGRFTYRFFELANLEVHENTQKQAKKSQKRTMLDTRILALAREHRQV